MTSIQQVTVRRHPLRIGTLFAVSMLASIQLSGNANAAGFVDGFEDVPSPWRFYSPDGTGGGDIMEGSGAHDGLRYARLVMAVGTATTQWVSVDRTFHTHIDSSAGCQLEVFFRAPYTPARIRLEMIDPATWSYIGFRDIDVPAATPPNTGYIHTVVDNSSPCKGDIVTRVVLFGRPNVPAPTVDVDTITLTYR